jgi:sec-independent protein translocase protein TatA
MLGSLGMGELVVIFLIALIIFGPKKLPELGRSLGKSLAEFKRASNELRNTLEEEIRVDEQRAAVDSTRVAATPPHGEAVAPANPVTPVSPVNPGNSVVRDHSA